MLALLVTAPLLAPGYLLLRDAVSTPRSYLSDSALGLSEAAPRALPQDFVVALASGLIDGGVVVKALLVAGLFLAGWGAARLAATVVPDAGMAGQFVAATIAVWNPYVAERLLQGHWSLLVGYGCLPWVAAAMLRLRTSEAAGRSDVCALAFWIALGGADPDRADAGRDGRVGLRLRAGFRPAAVVVRGRRARCRGAGGAAMADGGGGVRFVVVVRRPKVLRAFAARAEPGLGTLGSLASLGGIWNADAVPASRTTLFAVVAAVVLLGVVALGLPTVVRRPVAVPLLILAAVAVVVPAAMATGPGAGGRRGDDPDTARPRRGARRAEVGRAGRAGVLAGRRGRCCDAAPPDSGRGDRADLLCRIDCDVARSGLGSRRQGVRRCSIRPDGRVPRR